MTRKIIFVYKNDMKVLDDYINSLNIFDECIEIDNLADIYNKDDVYVYGQMWLNEDNIPNFC